MRNTIQRRLYSMLCCSKTCRRIDTCAMHINNVEFDSLVEVGLVYPLDQTCSAGTDMITHESNYSFLCGERANYKMYALGCASKLKTSEIKGGLAVKNVPLLQGWQCPKCKSILSPHQNWCPFCTTQNQPPEITVTT